MSNLDILLSRQQFQIYLSVNDIEIQENTFTFSFAQDRTEAICLT